TGRGTPLGVPAPTLKIASNSDLAQRKPNWIDFDAGQLLEAEDPNAVTDDLMQLILDTASGKEACNEINGFREITIWKQGVTL
ncbi:MAG: altronate dehydratase, partial [Luteolibacter sp.]